MRISLDKHSPHLLKELDSEKNGSFDPSSIGYSSTKKVWWKCDQGHSYYTSIGSRTRDNGTGCPYCSNQKVLRGFNDLETKRPDIAKEWDYEKNYPLKPSEILPGTQKKYWWKCPKNHSYYSDVNNRVRLNAGCPYCANKAVLKGYNDLATTNPELLKKWNYEKNDKLGYYPTNFTNVSGKKVWWKCEKGHEWEATIAHIKYGRGCPICNTGKQTSFPEQAIYYYISKVDKTCINRYKINGKNEIDIFLPKLNTGIEYDGYRWHRGEEKELTDYLKTDFWREQGVAIIRIKEQNKRNSSISSGDWICLNENEYYLNDEDYVALSEIIANIIKRLYDIDIKINIEDDRNEIYNNYLFKEIDNSMINNRKIMKYYDYEKNLDVKPEYITRSSGKILWWKCDNGHSFQASVHSMDQGKYCPICKEEQYRKLGFDFKDKKYIGHLKNVNDIKSFVDIKPELLKEWDYEKNGDINPYNLFPGTSQNVWWKCSICGHEWKAPVANRVKGHGCKKCGYKKASQKMYKPVLQYSKSGALIKEYSSVQKAIEATGILHVSCACRGDRKTAGGFIWKYKK